jgi:hypothetical protein
MLQLSISIPEHTCFDNDFTSTLSPHRVVVNGSSTVAVSSKVKLLHLVDMQTYADLQEQLHKALKDDQYLAFAQDIPLLWFMSTLEDMEKYISSYLLYFAVFGCERGTHPAVRSAILQHKLPISEIVHCFSESLTASQDQEFRTNLQIMCEYHKRGQ